VRGTTLRKLNRVSGGETVGDRFGMGGAYGLLSPQWRLVYTRKQCGKFAVGEQLVACSHARMCMHAARECGRVLCPGVAPRATRCNSAAAVLPPRAWRGGAQQLPQRDRQLGHSPIFKVLGS